jgi:hypothetical protein
LRAAAYQTAGDKQELEGCERVIRELEAMAPTGPFQASRRLSL